MKPLGVNERFYMKRIPSEFDINESEKDVLSSRKICQRNLPKNVHAMYNKWEARG